MSSELLNQFKELSAALRDLHRELLMLEARTLESESGRSLTPYELLHASLHDANLNWLRLISALIVNIDTTMDEIPNLTGKEANQIASEVLNLFEKPTAPAVTEFWAKYSKYLGSNAEIIMRHARVKTAVANLRPRM